MPLSELSQMIISAWPFGKKRSSSMQDATQIIQSSANSFDSSVHELKMFLDEWLVRYEEITTRKK